MGGAPAVNQMIIISQSVMFLLFISKQPLETKAQDLVTSLIVVSFDKAFFSFFDITESEDFKHPRIADKSVVLQCLDKNSNPKSKPSRIQYMQKVSIKFTKVQRNKKD